MAYSVFISYSTKDLHIANHVRAALSIPNVNVFIDEYSVPASAPLNAFIEMGLRGCDLFVLLWSRNSKASDYVPQENRNRARVQQDHLAYRAGTWPIGSGFRRWLEVPARVQRLRTST